MTHKQSLCGGGSAGVAEAGGNAIDRGGNGAIELGRRGLAGGGGGALAAEELHLDERHGVDVRIAQADRVVEDTVGLEQGGLAEDGKDHAAGEVELGLEDGKDAVAKGFVVDQVGVKAGDGEVGLGEANLDVADDVDEERKAAGHGLELGEIQCFTLGLVFSGSHIFGRCRGGWGTRAFCGRRWNFVLDEVLEGVADAEVCRYELARLHPAEDPGDGAEVLHAALAGGAGVRAFGRGASRCARVPVRRPEWTARSR